MLDVTASPKSQNSSGCLDDALPYDTEDEINTVCVVRMNHRVVDCKWALKWCAENIGAIASDYCWIENIDTGRIICASFGRIGRNMQLALSGDWDFVSGVSKEDIYLFRYDRDAVLFKLAIPVR